MTDLRTRIEQRITDLRLERDIAAAAGGVKWEAEKRYDEVSTVIAGTDPGFYEITVTGTLTDAIHIATQDPSTTIARIDRELAGCAADLALLAGKSMPESITELGSIHDWATAITAHLSARYPSEKSS